MNYLLPLMALRNIVVMPNSTVSFDVLRDISKKAIDASMNGSHEIILTAQKDPSVENPKTDDLFDIGTLCRIKQVVKLPQGMARVMVEGIERVAVLDFTETKPYFRAIAESVGETSAENAVKNAALARILQNNADEYIKLSGIMSRDELAKRLFDVSSLSILADSITGILNIDFRIKQEILEILDVYERVDMLISSIGFEIEILKMQKQLNGKVQKQLDRNQRDYYLREEKKIIEEELGEGVENEAEEYREKLEKLDLDADIREKIEKEITRFERMAGSNADSAVSRNYLDTVFELPWCEKTEENIDINEVRAILDAEHYGLEKVKERVVEHMAVRKLTDGKQGTLICLAGPPGTGKTSIAKSIARSVGRKYVRISLGGVRDEAEIRGHRKTYIGAMCGKIISGILQAKVKNPLILLDEIDKMGQDIKGDPSSALLEVLDYEQNKNFRDHYLDLPFDLSDVMFIATANDISNIPRPLLDRMELIEINGYTNLEKLQIAKNYLVPKQARENGLLNKKYEITDEALSKICEQYCKEAGVRQTERQIASLMRKLALKFAEGRRSLKVTDRNLKDYLGKPKYHYEMMNKENDVGIVRGLAWTAVGGDTLSVEVNVMDGTGKTELTGQLGDVMQESAKTAISYIRSVSNKLGIEKEFYKTKDIHIHVPEGAVPKDGPSAGVTMATAVASALTGRKVRRDIAMTGEITLRGRVLEIGGLKEKSIAAMRAGIGTVLIPEGNKADLDEIPDEVKSAVKFVPVKDMNTVLAHSFER